MDKLFFCNDNVELYDYDKPTGRTFTVMGTIADDALVRVDGHVLTFNKYTGDCREHLSLSIKHTKTPDMDKIKANIMTMHTNARNDRLSDKDYRDVITGILDELVKEFD
jgi:hypothetical protein